jgi:uncharacterized protein YlbG (UPF0298 family)
MTVKADIERERRALNVAKAVFEARQLKKFVDLAFVGKSKEYIVTYLVHAIQELKEIHDRYNPLGREVDKLEE